MATPITLARAPIDPAAKLECVSYAPFRGDQSPLIQTTMIAPEQIAQDLKQLAEISKCVRTYSVENGLDRVPELASQIPGLKVIQGIWLGSNRLKNLQEIATVVDLTKQYPTVITGVIVGNEVLLRGEITATDLVANIRSVKSQVGKMPVTYADVWEFWLKNRELYDAVDFVTIHILPYWEDFPIRAKFAAQHVDSIRKRVAVAFPDKEILIGETGWPSAGRMRDGALPSRASQARVVSEILDLAKKENFRVNLIEAYDQPWKRALEGTVGGYWGLFDADHRAVKYPAGVPITDFPRWKSLMAMGLLLSVVTFGVAILTLRRRPWPPRLTTWLAVFVMATGGGALFGIAAERMLFESYGVGGWARWGLLLTAGVLAPPLCANALLAGRPLPVFLDLFGPREHRTRQLLPIMLGLTLLVAAVLAVESALGFVFDPRYRDFPFASLTMAVLPFAMLALLNRPAEGKRPLAEAVFAGILVLSAIYTAFNEGPDNWQSLWSCATFALFGLTLWRARAAQNQGPAVR